jgi:D-sedoheptulose 7-phosphate isomerase
MSSLSVLERSRAECASLHDWFVSHEQNEGTPQRFSCVVVDCLNRGGRVLTCGNGGSMWDAMHFAEELSGRYRKDRRGLAAQSMSDPVASDVRGQ